MIEVEKKFNLDQQATERVIKGAEFLGEKSFTDSYLDTSDYSLTRNDKWLRLRDGKLELKLPLNNGKGANDRKLDQYQEVDTDEEIRKALQIPGDGSLIEDLEGAGYKIFSTFTTARRKYGKNNFIIDLDVIDFGYTIGEIELLVNEESQMEGALNKILDFAETNGLSVAPVRGKVIEYLRRKSPEHYQALIVAGVI